MSTKICVTAVKPTWKDAVTIGQLNQIIEGLYALGFDDDTPVTYLNDDDHVWLETVDAPDVVILITEEKLAAKAQGLTEEHRDRKWVDISGWEFSYVADRMWVAHKDGADSDHMYTEPFGEHWAPLTEVIEDK